MTTSLTTDTDSITDTDTITSTGSITSTDSITDTDSITGTPAVPAVSRKPRSRATRVLLAVLAAALLSLTGIGGNSSASAAGYDYSHTDSFNFWDASGNSVYIKGGVNWFHAGAPVPGLRTYRGEYAKGSYVILNKTGCLWVKVSWNNLTGSVSWPPSGGSNSVSDGFYRACGPRNTYIWLNGVGYASKKLYGSNVCIGFSDYASYTLRRYDSCHRMSN